MRNLGAAVVVLAILALFAIHYRWWGGAVLGIEGVWLALYVVAMTLGSWGVIVALALHADRRKAGKS